MRALPALWMGIFYDSAALAAAWDLCKDWKIEDHERLRADVARRGLKAEIAGRTVVDLDRVFDIERIEAGEIEFVPDFVTIETTA